MSLILILLIIILLTVIPVMIAAKLLKAPTSGFIVCLVAVIGSVLADRLAVHLLGEPPLTYLLALFLTVLIFMAVLGSRFLQSLLLAMLAVLVQYLIALALVALNLTTA